MKKAKQTDSRKTLKGPVPQEDIGPYFREMRLAAGLSKKEVSAYIGSTEQALQAYELGSRSIPMNRIYALANCLNIAPEEILRRIPGSK